MPAWQRGPASSESYFINMDHVGREPDQYDRCLVPSFCRESRESERADAGEPVRRGAASAEGAVAHE